jgi:hypothetical protein
MAEASRERIFLSYRRDDAAGYAGRLEEALERRLGRGSVFRDVLDIPPGEDFVAAIRARLAGAHTMLVLIGPRWAGAAADGTRRIDDEHDIVRLEVAVALQAGLRVIPVLLQGTPMPAAAALPAPLQELARRNALALGDANWDADVARLVRSIGLPPPRAVWPWALGGALAAGAVAAAVCLPWLRGGGADPAAASAAASAASAAAAAQAAARLAGVWAAEVDYGWARQTEHFEFKQHAGTLTGTASFVGHPRGIEALRFDGRNLHFETRTQESAGDRIYDLTHRYAAELHGAPPGEVLAVRMHTTGGFGGSRKPLEFEARRAASAGLGASSAR